MKMLRDPLEDMFERDVSPDMKIVIKSILKKIENKEIPESFPDYMLNSRGCFYSRNKVIDLMGFILIDKDWIQPLAKWIGERKCLEVMSGSGALSYALTQEGVNIITTDNYSWKSESNDNWWSKHRMWTFVEGIDAVEAVEKYGKKVNMIIMSWPYMDDTAVRVLRKMREVNPFCIMIYIGEGYGGCTANDEFFDEMKEIDDDNFEDVARLFKRWYGLHDMPVLIK